MNAFLGRDEYSLNSDVNFCAWERLLVGQDLQILSNCFSSYSGQKPSCFSRSWSSRGKEFWQAFLSPETADHGSKMLVFFFKSFARENHFSLLLCALRFCLVFLFFCVSQCYIYEVTFTVTTDRSTRNMLVGWAQRFPHALKCSLGFSLHLVTIT